MGQEVLNYVDNTSKERVRVLDSFSGLANITKTYTTPMKEFCIINDGASTLSFTIGSVTISVKQGETYDGKFPVFTSVTVTTAVSYRAEVRG